MRVYGFFRGISIGTRVFRMKRKGYFIEGQGISLRREDISLCGVGISRGLHGISAGKIREISMFGRVPTKKKCAVKNPSAHRHFTDIAHNWGEVA